MSTPSDRESHHAMIHLLMMGDQDCPVRLDTCYLCEEEKTVKIDVLPRNVTRLVQGWLPGANLGDGARKVLQGARVTRAEFGTNGILVIELKNQDCMIWLSTQASWAQVLVEQEDETLSPYGAEGDW